MKINKLSGYLQRDVAAAFMTPVRFGGGLAS